MSAAPPPSLLRRLLSPPYEPRLQREVLQLGLRSLIPSAVTPLVVTPLLWFALGDSVPRQAFLVWALLMGLITVAMLTLRWLQRRAIGQAPDAAALARFYPLTLLLLPALGAGWGGVALMLTPEQPVVNAVLMVVYLGALTAGATNIGVWNLRAYVLIVGVSLPFMLGLLPHAFNDSAILLQVGLMLVVWTVVNTARNAQATLVRSIQLQFANEGLLADARREAEAAARANRDKSLFLAAASHDLRQPVHAMLLLLEALRQRTRDAGVRELVDYVHQAGDAIGQLFSSLMELSRLESGAERADVAPAALAPLLREALERHRPQAERAGLGLTLRLGRGAETAWLATDRVLLTRILDNLLANAVRYTRSGRILLSARRRGASWWLEVRDTGIGIAPEHQERIFEPYWQVANPERDRRKGLGLGMAIVRQTAQLLAHPVTLRSSLGRGSCFRIAVPATQPPMEESRAVPAPAARPQNLAGRRVLVVDDDPMVLHAMQLLLNGWQVDCRCVTGESEAVALVQSQGWAPEAVLCDFRLAGGRDGIAVLDRLCELCPGAAALLQTGELAPQVRLAAEEAGYLVLAKPVPAGLLATTLETVLDPD